MIVIDPIRTHFEGEDHEVPRCLVGYNTLQIGLDSLLAQEIFSNFMAALAESIAQGGGVTREKMTRSHSMWENSALKSLTETLYNSGLVGSMEEASLLIIPPIFNQAELPTELSP